MSDLSDLLEQCSARLASSHSHLAGMRVDEGAALIAVARAEYEARKHAESVPDGTAWWKRMNELSDAVEVALDALKEVLERG